VAGQEKAAASETETRLREISRSFGKILGCGNHERGFQTRKGGRRKSSLGQRKKGRERLSGELPWKGEVKRKGRNENHMEKHSI